MDLGQLEKVVAVADAGTVTAAAHRLFVTQSAVSQAVAALETELGVPLFTRSRRGMRPTAVGSKLIGQARVVLAGVADLRSSAERSRDGFEGSVRVGFEATGGGELMTQAAATLRRRRERVALEPRRLDWGAEVDALREGLVDVAWVWLPADLGGLTSVEVHVEPRLVGLPADHAAATAESLSLADVADEPLMWTRDAPKEWVNWWAVNPRPDGREPVWGKVNGNVEEMLEGVAAGAGICIAPESLSRYYARPGITWVRLRDAEPLRVALAWSEPIDPATRAYVAIVRELASASGRPVPPSPVPMRP